MSIARLAAPAAPRTAAPQAVAGLALAQLLRTQLAGGAGLVAAATVAGLMAAELGGAGAAGLALIASAAGAVAALPLAAAMRRWGLPRGLRLGWFAGVAGAGTVVGAALVGSLPALLIGMALLGGGDTSGAVARIAVTDVTLPRRPAAAAGLVVSVTALTVAIGHAATAHVATLAGVGMPALAGSFAASATVFLGAGRALAATLRATPAMRTDDRRATVRVRDDDHRTTALVVAVAASAAVAVAAAGTAVVAVLTVAVLKLGVGFGLAFGAGAPHGRCSSSAVEQVLRAAARWHTDRAVTPACLVAAA